MIGNTTQKLELYHGAACFFPKDGEPVNKIYIVGPCIDREEAKSLIEARAREDFPIIRKGDALSISTHRMDQNALLRLMEKAGTVRLPEDGSSDDLTILDADLIG